MIDILYKWIRDYIAKYSFIKFTKFTNATLYVYYEHDGKIKAKHLPFRATKNQLIRTIENIKKEIGYYEDKNAE